MKLILALLLALATAACSVEAAPRPQTTLTWQQTCTAVDTAAGFETTCTGVIPPFSAPSPTSSPTSTPTPPVSVAAAGLVADGATDNCQALTALAKQGDPVHLPSGVIVFSCPIDFNAFVDQGVEIQDIIWQGNGPFSTTLKYTGTGVGITVGRLSPFYGPSLYWRDFSYIGNGAPGHTARTIGGYATSDAASGTTGTQTGLMLHSLTVPGPVFENVQLKFWDTALVTQNVYNLELRNSVVQTNNVGLQMSHTTTASTVRRTEFAGNAVGIWLEGIGIQNVHILDNVFEANHGGAAILSNGGEFITVEGNYFTANKDNFVHSGYNALTCPNCGLLNGAYLLRNYGISAKFGDSVRLVEVRDNAVDDTLDYSIRNEYAENVGQARRIYIGRNWSAFGEPAYQPYTRYDGAQAAEFIRESP